MQDNASRGEWANHTSIIVKYPVDSTWAVSTRKSLLPEHPLSGSYTVHQFQFN